MNWNQLLSIKRLGKPSSGKITADTRTQFQRDYDRLIFSSPFRRLQNKTQVFPLPGSVFVHNRLTHSLEVASVGRSLGNIVSERIAEKGVDHLLLSEIGSVVAAACLAHDLGNPPFGHSGEDAIKEYFAHGEGRQYRNVLSDEEWADLTKFDGNANALRILSHQFNGRRIGGYALTYTMLASIVKYPSAAIDAPKEKFGFFQSEKETYREIAKELGIDFDGKKFARHPLVYLVEAADDICYQIMDIEDAYKLKILTYEETMNLYLGFYDLEKDARRLDDIHRTMNEVTDPNEQITFLRAGVIGKLIYECANVFMTNYDAIMDGKYTSTLIKDLSDTTKDAMGRIVDVSIEKVYADSRVIEIELSGYKIISTLISHFAMAVLNDDKHSRKLMKLFPDQFLASKDDTYSKLQSVVDFISGMTDVYALDLYRKITGITVPTL